MHQRKLIRDAVTSILIAAATAAGSKVYPTRVLPFVLPELPVISVYTLDESVDPDSANTAPRELTRTLSVVIEAMSAPGPDIDDTMDALALEIETAMHADPYLGDVCVDSLLASTEIESIEEGDREVGWMALTYSVTYRTEAPDAPTNLDDFNTAYATHNLGNDVHTDEDAEDSITVQV